MIYATFEAFYAEVRRHLPQVTLDQVETWDYPRGQKWDTASVKACVADLQQPICPLSLNTL